MRHSNLIADASSEVWAHRQHHVIDRGSARRGSHGQSHQFDEGWFGVRHTRPGDRVWTSCVMSANAASMSRLLNAEYACSIRVLVILIMLHSEMALRLWIEHGFDSRSLLLQGWIGSR
jgi:hypothetical protein